MVGQVLGHYRIGEVAGSGNQRRGARRHSLTLRAGGGSFCVAMGSRQCCYSKTSESLTESSSRFHHMTTRGSAVLDALAVVGARKRRAAGAVPAAILRNRLSMRAVRHGTRLQPGGVALVAVISGDGHHACNVSCGPYMPSGTNRARTGARSWREPLHKADGGRRRAIPVAPWRRQWHRPCGHLPRA